MAVERPPDLGATLMGASRVATPGSSRKLGFDSASRVVDFGPVTHAIRSLLLVLLVSTPMFCGGCRDLPNPDADALARTLRRLDAAQRPNGEDLPVERFVAWTAERDAGLRAPPTLVDELRGIVDLQRALVKRLETVEATTEEAKALLKAYVDAHAAIHMGMETSFEGLRLSNGDDVRSGDARVKQGLDALRSARTLRKRLSDTLEVPEILPEEREPASGASVRKKSSAE
jgi:hypothetical protein